MYIMHKKLCLSWIFFFNMVWLNIVFINISAIQQWDEVQFSNLNELLDTHTFGSSGFFIC